MALEQDLLAAEGVNFNGASATKTPRFLYELAAGAITAGTTRTRAGAKVLAAQMNQVDTATAPSAGTTLGDGVLLPVSVAGSEIEVVNNTLYPIQVYGAGSDTINGVAGSTGVPLPPGSAAFFLCSVAGAWKFDSGIANSGALPGVLACDGVAAAGTTQATGTQLSTTFNNISTVSAGAGVNLPASAPGLAVMVQNSGANPLLVYPAQGASDTINGIAAGTGVLVLVGATAAFNCTTAGAWTVQPASTATAAYNAAANTTAFTATAAQVTGGVSSVDLALTGTLGAGANITTPTAALIVAALHCPTVGTSYRLRITNRSGGAFSWTVVAGSGITLTGTATIAQNTWREFVVTVTNAATPAVTLQSVATGTYS